MKKSELKAIAVKGEDSRPEFTQDIHNVDVLAAEMVAFSNSEGGRILIEGFEEDGNWTVAGWREDQSVDLRDEINREWTDLVVRKRSFPPNIKLTEKAKQMFFLVSYDIDKFKDFVFESSFLERINVDDATVEKIKTDEIELLKFGLEWLKGVLFKQTDPDQQGANFADKDSSA